MKSVVLIFLLVFLSLQANADFKKFNEEMVPVLKDFNEKKYELAFDQILPLHEAGNVFATHYLGVMFLHGLYVEKDLDAAAAYFDFAAKDAKAGGNIDSLYMLARNFYSNPDSKYYNFRKGYKYYLILEKVEHPLGTFNLGVNTLILLKNHKDPKYILDFSERALQKAVKLGVPDAKFVLYMVEKEKLKRGYINKLSTIEYLKELASKKSDIQAQVAYELAWIYKRGVHVAKNLSEYVKLLQVAFDVGKNPEAAYDLGEAFLLGMVDDPDYSSAEFYFEYAKLNNVKGSDLALKRVKIRAAEEAKLDTYETDDSWFQNFIAMQSFESSINIPIANNDYQKPDYSSLNEKLPITSTRMKTYRRTGNTIWGSDGTSFRITGNNIRSSNGINYRITGKNITGSNGSSYRLTGKNIRSSNGTNYRITGNSIRGSDGTRCRTTGRTTRCY